MDQALALGQFEQTLARGGLDLIAPIPGPELRWLVGNTRALWPAFISALRVTPALQHTEHPLDAYVESVIERAIHDSATPIHVDWGHSTTPPPLQRLAVDAGLGWKSPAHLIVHPEYGPWIGLRAVLTFEGIEGIPHVEPAPPCHGCEGGCRPALAEVMADCPLTAEAVKAQWPRWAAIRQACPVGQNHMYPPDQLAYHYTHDRQWLSNKECVDRHKTGNAQ
ncbi:MAG: hypothetical protein ACE366_18950 [Bradymonadia bacterium]